MRGGQHVGIPFAAIHLAMPMVFVVGWSATAAAVAVGLYAVRALAITVVYHRGLAHRSFRMPRAVQAVGATVATTAGQRGPLWWVGHHRIHHRRTDKDGDPHSPVVAGFWRAHLLWLFDERNQETDPTAVPDLAALPEMRLLDRWHHAVTAGLAAATFLTGVALARFDPALEVNGPQLFVWAFCLSTLALWHSTFAVNSFAHRFGPRRFATDDESRNLWWVAVLTFGEGWHNNHHRFPRSARQGLGRFELDPSWWVIWVMGRVGLADGIRVASSVRIATALTEDRKPPGQRRSRCSASTAAASAVASVPLHPAPRRLA